MAKLSDFTLGFMIVVAHSVWLRVEKDSTRSRKARKRPSVALDTVSAAPELASWSPKERRYFM